MLRKADTGRGVRFVRVSYSAVRFLHSLEQPLAQWVAVVHLVIVARTALPHFGVHPSEQVASLNCCCVQREEDPSVVMFEAVGFAILERKFEEFAIIPTCLIKCCGMVH